MNQTSYDIESEMRLLGGCMRNQDWVSEAVPNLTISHFFDPRNREIFAQIQLLYEKDHEVTLASLEALTPNKGASVNYLMDVYILGSEALFISDLMESIKNAYKKRECERIGEAIVAASKLSSSKPEEIVSSAEEAFFQLSQDSHKKILRTPSQILNDPTPFLKRLEERQQLFREGKSSFQGIPTGFLDLDNHIQGLSKGHLTVIGARPGMGKTTCALNLVEKLFQKSIPVLFFSLEMPASELLEKLICQIAEVDHKLYAKGSISGADFQKLVSVSRHLEAHSHLLIDDQPSLAIDQIKNRALRAKKVFGIQAIFIDYLQLVTSNRKGTDIRHLEIADISRRLKEIAKELQVPVIALAQLNRETEKRTSKEPFLSDLRESGSIEADADEVILLHRPEMYDIHDKPGLIKFIIAKNRFGQTGSFLMVFEKNYGGFKDYAFKDQGTKIISNSVSKESDSWNGFDDRFSPS